MTIENIAIRALEPEDLDYLYDVENNPQTWVYGGQKNYFSKYDLKRFIENSHQDITISYQKRFIIENNDLQRVGTVDLFDFDPINKRVGLGIMIYPPQHRQKGYAQMALEKIHKFCFNSLSLHQIYVEIQEDNTNSIKLFEKLGYQNCGTKRDWLFENNKWQSVVCMQLFNKITF